MPRACPSRPSSTASPTPPRAPWPGSSRSTPATSWRWRRPTGRCARSRGASCSGAPGTTETPSDEGSFCVRTDDAEARVNHAWLRGGWFDDLTLAWRDVEEGACYDRPIVTGAPPSPGATVFVPFNLAPGATKAIAVQLSWYVGKSSLRVGDDPADEFPVGEWRYRPWYAKRFSGIEEAAEAWRVRYPELREKTARFSSCFYDTTLPPEVVEAVAANLTILKSPDGPAAGGRAPLELGGLRRRAGAAATGPARTCGTTPRRCRTSSRRWSGRCARRSSESPGRPRPPDLPAPLCPSGPPLTTSTPRPTASSAAS